MKLIRLGDYIEQIDIRKADNNYKSKDVMGISVNKILIPTKAKVDNLELKNYKIFGKGQFSYCLVTSRNGNKISIVYNDYKNCIISSINPIFKIKNEKSTELNPYFLFMYFKRKEFDRYARYNSWGSARETFSWEDFCDIQIPLPSIEIQNKYVDIYKAMNENLKSYERNLEDLKLVCDAYIEKLRKKMNCCSIGEFLEYKNNKNTNSLVNLVQGVENTHTFINTRAKMSGIDIKGYKIVENKDFAYNPARINIGSIALREGPTCVVSPMYEIFSVSDSSKLLPEYLMLWFSREEFKHYTFYYSFGSVRDTFEFNLMKDVSIPIPSVDIQKSIVNIYNGYKSRIEIANKLKEKIDNICPILIAGAIKEAKANE